jgi:hypothetical protein
MPDAANFKPVTILDRQIEISLPNATQLGLMNRAAKVATVAGEQLEDENLAKEKKEELTQAAINAIDRTLTIVESMFVHQADRDWAVEQMLAGRLELETVLDAIKGLELEEKQAPPLKKVAAKKARRAT